MVFERKKERRKGDSIDCPTHALIQGTKWHGKWGWKSNGVEPEADGGNLVKNTLNSIITVFTQVKLLATSSTIRLKCWKAQNIFPHSSPS